MQDGASSSLGRSRPLSLGQLFWAFSWLALQGFGGVLAVVQHELVDKRRWLTREEFVEEWAVAQVLPGANVVNLALMMGDRYFGWRGGLVAMAGLLTFPTIIVLVLAALFAEVADHPQVQGAMRGMAAVAAGIIVAAGLRLLPSLKKNVLPTHMQWLLIALTFIAIALLRMRLIWVLGGLGGLAAVWAYRLLGQTSRGSGKGSGKGAGQAAPPVTEKPAVQPEGPAA
ncbi:chromate transporter [Rhodoferax sp. 4810]|nr:chromate transporter [Rhodoferax jenense]